MLMSLGLFVFELATLPYEELVRSTDFRHATSPRFGARPASQYLGPGEDRITLTGAVAPQVAGSLASLREMRALGEAGEALPLVDGTGRVLGNFVLVRLDERQGSIIDNGLPRRTDFTIDLDRVS